MSWYQKFYRKILLKCYNKYHAIVAVFYGTQIYGYLCLWINLYFNINVIFYCFPRGSDGKESACNAGDQGSIPGLERSLGEGQGKPSQYYCLENSTDIGTWWATVYRVTKSRKRLSICHFLLFGGTMCIAFLYFSVSIWRNSLRINGWVKGYAHLKAVFKYQSYFQNNYMKLHTQYRGLYRVAAGFKSFKIFDMVIWKVASLFKICISKLFVSIEIL